VPVVVIFTKFDALADMCNTKLRNQGMEYQEAESAVPDLAEKTFQEEYLSRILSTEFPPKAHVCLAGNLLCSYIFLKFSQNIRNEQKRKPMF